MHFIQKNRNTSKDFDEIVYDFPWYAGDHLFSFCYGGITKAKSASCRQISTEGGGLYLLEYIVSGRGHLNVGNHYFSVKQGDVFLIPPGVAYEFHADADDPWEKFWIDFTGSLADTLYGAYQLRGRFYFPDCPLGKEFRALFASLTETEVSQPEAPELALLRMFVVLRGWLLKHRGEETAPDARILRDYLNANCSQNVSCAELAGLIHRSEAQMQRIFRQAWGTTPYQYLQQLRNTGAKQYLKNTNSPLKEIAAMLGFCDEFYFSNWFKKRNACSPRTYRVGSRQNIK